MKKEVTKTANRFAHMIITMLVIIMVLFSTLVLYSCKNVEEASVNSEESTQYPALEVQIEKDGVTETIVPEWDEKSCTIYLPSFAAEAEVTLSAGDDVTINGVPANEADLWKEGTYILKTADREYALTIYTSGDVGTVFINTDSKSMDQVYADASYKERIDISVFEDDGTLNYQNSEDKIKLRGNSTSYRQKRPFNLKLHDEESILGLRTSKDFALLANAYDRSGLRDVIYKGLSKEMGFEYSADTRYVDVYLNGEYNGLYVLSEKVSVSEDYLNLEDGSYLCAVELLNNMKEGDIYVDSTLQEIFEITYPEDPSKKELNEIEEYLTSFERALISEDGIDHQSGKSWDQMIDMESWAKAYIIDEVMANVDSSLASSYIYYDSSDGLLYKGPIWDGDRVLGNQHCNEDPQTLMACQGHGYNYNLTAYYTYLLEKDEFRETVKEIYKQYDFLSLLNDLIDEKSDEIKTAKEIDSVRWGELYDKLEKELQTSVIDAQDMKTYVKERVSYLNEVIPQVEEYAVICIYESGTNYEYVTVRKGTCYTPEDSSVNYINIDTGDYVDFTQPITDNIAIEKEKQES